MTEEKALHTRAVPVTLALVALLCTVIPDQGVKADIGGTFTQLALGEAHTCGLRKNGAVECWGRDTWGEASPPARARSVQLAAGDRFTCGRTKDGRVDCWGEIPQDRDGQPGETAEGALVLERPAIDIAARGELLAVLQDEGWLNMFEDGGFDSSARRFEGMVDA